MGQGKQKPHSRKEARAMARYKVGLKKAEKWIYIIYQNEEDLLFDVADYILTYDKVSITSLD